MQTFTQEEKLHLKRLDYIPIEITNSVGVEQEINGFSWR